MLLCASEVCGGGGSDAPCSWSRLIDHAGCVCFIEANARHTPLLSAAAIESPFAHASLMSVLEADTDEEANDVEAIRCVRSASPSAATMLSAPPRRALLRVGEAVTLLPVEETGCAR
jgi:hypothetical protein